MRNAFLRNLNFPCRKWTLKLYRMIVANDGLEQLDAEKQFTMYFFVPVTKR